MTEWLNTPATYGDVLGLLLMIGAVIVVVGTILEVISSIFKRR